MDIVVKEQTPGLAQAVQINAKLAEIGIFDVQLMYDKQVNMWAVVQIQKKAPSQILLPKTYKQTDLKPYLLFWCKNEQAKFRVPNWDDLANIIKMVQRAPDIWAMGEKRADKFDEQDAEKDRKHQAKFKERIHSVAPSLKKAIKEGRL